MYDTHCHPYLAKEKSQESILENFFRDGGIHLNSIGTDLDSSKNCIELAKNYTGVYATIGIHPTHCLDYMGKPEQTIAELRNMYTQNSQHIVGIGEAGLDYYWLDSLSEKYSLSRQDIVLTQKHFFTAQIHLAKQLQIPLVIHNRESSEDIFEILVQKNYTNFVFHCFSEDLDFAQRLLEFAPDCKLGFGGVATFKNAQKTRDVIQNIPLKNIIIETDSPYLTPVPYRGKQENEPLFVKYVLDTIVDLREEGEEEVKKKVYENSIEFFGVSQKAA